MEYGSSGEIKGWWFISDFLNIPLRGLSHRRLRYRQRRKGFGAQLLSWKPWRWTTCMWIDRWTTIFDFPRLCWYIPSLSGGSEHRIHFIQAWRKNSRLHSGVLRDGVFPLLPVAKLPVQSSFSNCLAHPAFGSALLKQLSGHVGELREVSEKASPPWSHPEKPEQIHKYDSLAGPWPPGLGSKTPVQYQALFYPLSSIIFSCEYYELGRRGRILGFLLRGNGRLKW